jgi:hypothetical protein
MSDFARAAAVALTAAVCLAASPVQAQPASAIEGVWKVSRVDVTGANPLTVADPRPGLYIFARGHYSNVNETGSGPRTAAPPANDPANPTDAEKLARYQEWAPFAAQAGTYEVKGSTLVRHPMVAKNLVALTPPDQAAEFKLSGDTLVITTRSQPGQPAREQRLTLTRVR